MHTPRYIVRESRLMTSLRIISPLMLFFVIMALVALIPGLDDYEAILFVLTFFVAVYFTYYMLDRWIIESKIDPIFEVHNAMSLQEHLQKLIDRRQNAVLLMIRIDQMRALERRMALEESQKLMLTCVKSLEKLLFKEYKHTKPMLAKYRDDSLFVVVEGESIVGEDLARVILRRSIGWLYNDEAMALRIVVGTLGDYTQSYDLIVRLYHLMSMIKSGNERLLIEHEPNQKSTDYNLYDLPKTIEAIPIMGDYGVEARIAVVSLQNQKTKLSRHHYLPLLRRSNQEALFILSLLQEIHYDETPLLISITDELLCQDTVWDNEFQVYKESQMIFEIALTGDIAIPQLLSICDYRVQQGYKLALGGFIPSMSMLRIATHRAFGWVLLEKTVMDAIKDDSTQRLIQSLSMMFGSIGKKFVVTGVGHIITDNKLKTLGVIYRQGKYFRFASKVMKLHRE